MNKFEPIPGANYKHDYVEIFRAIDAGQIKAVLVAAGDAVRENQTLVDFV